MAGLQLVYEWPELCPDVARALAPLGAPASRLRRSHPPPGTESVLQAESFGDPRAAGRGPDLGQGEPHTALSSERRAILSTQGPGETGCPCAGRKCDAHLTPHTRIYSEWVKDFILTPNTIKSPLAVQWLRLSTPSAEGLGLTPGQGTRSRVLQLSPGAAKSINIYF